MRLECSKNLHKTNKEKIYFLYMYVCMSFTLMSKITQCSGTVLVQSVVETYTGSRFNFFSEIALPIFGQRKGNR